MGKKVSDDTFLPLVWDDASNIPSVYANNILSTFAGGSEFFIIFGELQAPIRFGTSNEELPKSVHVKPVAKIVVTPETMIKLSEVINQNLKRYLKAKEETNNQDI